MAHLTQAELQGMREGTLKGEPYLNALEHIDSCDTCAVLLAEQVEKQPLLTLPVDFQAGVKNKLRASEREEAERNYRVYRRRVLLAMCATLVLVFSGVFTQLGNLQISKISQTNSSISQKIKMNFTSFSQKFWIMEEHTNEHSKK